MLQYSSRILSQRNSAKPQPLHRHENNIPPAGTLKKLSSHVTVLMYTLYRKANVLSTSSNATTSRRFFFSVSHSSARRENPTLLRNRAVDHPREQQIKSTFHRGNKYLYIGNTIGKCTGKKSVSNIKAECGPTRRRCDDRRILP